MGTIQTEVVVIGAGPGGYAAAFYAADRGKSVVLVERDPQLGGVCLTRGCIPSKALLHAAHLISAAEESSERGIVFAPPTIDTSKLRSWKNTVVAKLSSGVTALAKGRGVDVLKGQGRFEDPHTLRVESGDGPQHVEFENAIVAVGSRPLVPRSWNLGSPQVMTSTEALEIESIPDNLMIVGGGYIGMELGTVYAALGSKVVVVEALGSVLTGVDADLLRPVVRRASETFSELRVATKVKQLAVSGREIEVTTESGGEEVRELFDRVLVAVGRRPNSEDLGLDQAGVRLDDAGFIQTGPGQQTTAPNIYAIGDVAGGVLLAHKASREARVAVDAILGEDSVFDCVIPAVVFTDPEIAWCGLTETEAKERNIKVEIAKFPWTASGRAIAMDRPDGLTKLVVEPETERILGMGIVGVGAGELIGEGVVLMEMGGTVRDLADSIHPHPTLSETLMESAEMFFGHATHAAARRKRPTR